MHKIMTLYDQICDTEADARHFAECALKYKETDRELADMYIGLARADMDQCSRLHAQIVRLANKFAAEHAPEGEAIHELCEWHTTKLNGKLAELKLLLDSYKQMIV